MMKNTRLLLAIACCSSPRSVAATGPFKDAVVATLDVGKKGFAGGFTDGRHGYLVPHEDAGAWFGIVTRFRLDGFTDLETLNVADKDSDLKGFWGGFTDGRHGYLVPYHNTAQRHGKVARFRLDGFDNVELLNVADKDPDLKGFYGGFTDGRHGYLVPYNNGAAFGKVARFRLARFTDVEVLNVATTDGDLKGFGNGFTDGRHGYLIQPDSGKVARFRLDRFKDVEVLNPAAKLNDADLKGFYGGFTDSRHGYLVPYGSSKVVRFGLDDLECEVLNLADTETDLKGFRDGFTDGRYGYVLPHHNGAWFGKVARFLLDGFKDVEVLDVAGTDADAKGFLGGFTDGRHGYLVPYHKTKVPQFLVEGSPNKCLKVPHRAYAQWKVKPQLR